jgi:5-methylthioadenosine/S-adenosylhomocysteine deaminase
MLAELQSAALIAKLESSQATALPAVSALELATINGARALGMEQVIGSLEIGKDADMIAIDLREPHTQPLNNVISQLVYATGGHEVSHSWVQGRPLVKNREVIGLDVTGVIERANHWSTQLASRGYKDAEDE